MLCAEKVTDQPKKRNTQPGSMITFKDDHIQWGKNNIIKLHYNLQFYIYNFALLLQLYLHMPCLAIVVGRSINFTQYNDND